MLQAVHGFGIEQVELAFPPPLVLTASPQISMSYFFRVVEIRETVPQRNLFGKNVEVNAPQLRGCVGEIVVNDLIRKAYTFKYLSTGVTSNSRDTHLGHDFEHALRTSFDVVPHRCFAVNFCDRALFDEIFDRFDCEIRVDRTSPIAE